MTNPPTEPQRNNRWLNGLDSIRIVLALIVMLGHVNDMFIAGIDTHSKYINIILTISKQLFCGPAAVIVFFVLSGIVIHYPNRNKTNFDIRVFYVRRIIRIGIPLLVIYLISTHYNVFNVVPVWSLYCEIIYYVVYPFLFKLKISWLKLCKISFVITFLVLVILNFDSLLSFVHQKNINYKAYYWSYGYWMAAFFGLPAWLMGATIASRIDTLTEVPSFKTLMIYRVSMYLMSCILLIASFHFYLGYIFTLNFFAIFATKWLEYEILYYREHDCFKWLEYGGKFSYTLYLWHVVLIIAIGQFIPTTVTYYLLFIVLAVALSYMLYLTIELPSQKAAQYLANKFPKPHNT